MSFTYALLHHMYLAFTLRHDGAGLPERYSSILLVLLLAFVTLNYHFLSLITSPEDNSPYIGLGGLLLAIVMLVTLRPRLTALILLTKLSGLLLAIVGFALIGGAESSATALTLILVWTDIAAIVAVVNFSKAARQARKDKDL